MNTETILGKAPYSEGPGQEFQAIDMEFLFHLRPQPPGSGALTYRPPACTRSIRLDYYIGGRAKQSTSIPSVQVRLPPMQLFPGLCRQGNRRIEMSESGKGCVFQILQVPVV
jgi:hypothetical protein